MSRRNKSNRRAELIERLEPRQLMCRSLMHPLAQGQSLRSVSPTLPAVISPSTSWGATPLVLSGAMQVEHFDRGGQNVGWFDTTPRNQLNAFRADDVDLRWASGSTTNAIARARPGEWLRYTVDVPTAGMYDIDFRVSSGAGGGAFRLDFAASTSSPIYATTGTTSFNGTGNWNNFITVRRSVALDAGPQVMTLRFESSRWANNNLGDFDRIDFTPSATPNPQLNSRWPVQWTRMADGPLRRFESYSFVHNNQLFVMGGWNDFRFIGNRRVDVLDLTTGQWSRKQDMPVPETHSGMAYDEASGSVYFVKGTRGAWPSVEVKESWRYDIAGDTWERMADLPEVGFAGAAQVVGRKLYYFGGVKPDRVTNVGDHYVMDLDNPSAGWSMLAPLPVPRDHLSSVVLDGKIYAMMGEIGYETLFLQQKLVHVYDPQTDTWTRLADSPVAKSHNEYSTFVLDGKIISAGGQVTPQIATNLVHAYDPATNTWSQIGTLPAARQGAAIRAVGDLVLVSHGADATTRNHQSTLWFGRLGPVQPPIVPTNQTTPVVSSRAAWLTRGLVSGIVSGTMLVNTRKPQQTILDA
jgi:hypothetical protein